MKRIISFALILACLISVLSINVNADLYKISDEGLLPFEDVKGKAWYEDGVIFCYVNSVIKGMNSYTFAPGNTLTRAQFVTMLASVEGIDTSKYTETQFTDVKVSHWYCGAVAWAYEKGIVNGMTDTTFDPNGELTRAQLATIMYNYMEDKYTVEVSDDVLDRFSDKPKTEYWYYDAMKYAVSAGLISGMSNGTLSSTGFVTRAQAAVIFKSFMERYYYGYCGHEFTESDCTNSSSCTACGMVKGLPRGHHVSIYYDCRDEDKCSVCGVVVQPSKILHRYASATCTRASVCTICGNYRGEIDPDAHNFFATSCTKPQYCQRCGFTVGEPYGHTTDFGICTRCNKEVFANDYRKVSYYISKKGTADGKGHYLLYDYKEYDDGGMSYNEIYYDANTGSFILQSVSYLAPASRYDQLIVTIPALLDTYRCDYREYDKNGKLLGSGVGYVDPSDVPCDVSPDINWTQMNGNRNVSYMKDSAENDLRYLIMAVDKMLYLLCGEGVEALGFDHPDYLNN